MSERRRVRVTVDAGSLSAPLRYPSARTEPRAADEAEEIYLRGLIRAQLRLALGCLLGFLVAAGALTVLLVAVPALNAVVILGTPLPWLLHAYGYYPIIFVFALLYARSARRNERRYRLLRSGGE
ncbi:hypothetical protein [Microbacterium gorillae]|uniref:hypothetical protein n=1 Tax=Microbacterium gorillae TaxID=1231063 RepID=UPI00058D3665|nr:hypothetical protein [Microbacterium gorillae]